MTIQDERRLTELLHGVAVPPSRVDVGRAMADGVVRKRRRAILAIGAVAGTVAVAVVVVPAVTTGPQPAPGHIRRSDPPAAPLWTNCRPEPLPPPAGAERMLLAAIDPSGRYVVARQSDGTGAVILWTDGAASVVDRSGMVVRDVNRSGMMVGSKDGRVWLYRDGGWSDLGVSGQPWALNDRGDILGVDRDRRLVVWPAGHLDRPRILAGGVTNYVVPYYDIADDGTVAAPASDDRPRVWAPDGTARELSLLPGLTGGIVTRLNGGWAVGIGHRPDPNRSKLGTAISVEVPLRWRLDTGTVEELPIAVPDTIAGVTARGEAVFNGVTRPVTVVAPDGTRDELPPAGDEPRTLVIGVSDDGRTIAGDAYGKADESVPYVWRC